MDIYLNPFESPGTPLAHKQIYVVVLSGTDFYVFFRCIENYKANIYF